MKHKAKAYIMGAYEHPTRYAPDKSVTQLHAECALGALKDAGLSIKDVDGFFCAGDAPGAGPIALVDYLNLKLTWMDGTELGGCSYMIHVRHAAQAIAEGKCKVALITLAGNRKAWVWQQALPQDRLVQIDLRPHGTCPTDQRSRVCMAC